MPEKQWRWRKTSRFERSLGAQGDSTWQLIGCGTKGERMVRKTPCFWHPSGNHMLGFSISCECFGKEYGEVSFEKNGYKCIYNRSVLLVLRYVDLKLRREIWDKTWEWSTYRWFDGVSKQERCAALDIKTRPHYLRTQQQKRRTQRK